MSKSVHLRQVVNANRCPLVQEDVVFSNKAHFHTNTSSNNLLSQMENHGSNQRKLSFRKMPLAVDKNNPPNDDSEAHDLHSKRMKVHDNREQLDNIVEASFAPNVPAKATPNPPSKTATTTTTTTNTKNRNRKSPTTVVDVHMEDVTTEAPAHSRDAGKTSPTATNKNSSKKHTIHNIQAQTIHKSLSSTTVASALFPDGCRVTYKLTFSDEISDKQALTEGWKKGLDAIIAHFNKYGLTLDYTRSPHFFPTNYQLTEEELAEKMVKIERQNKHKAKSGKKTKSLNPAKSRPWPQQTFYKDRKFFLHCSTCKKAANILSVVAVGKFLHESGSDECHAQIEHVFYHDSDCCCTKGTSQLKTEHHTVFKYSHGDIFCGVLEHTAKDLQQFTANNPTRIPDGKPIAASDIRYDDRTFVDLPLKEDIPKNSLWRNGIDTDSVSFQQFIVRLGYCMSSKLNLSKDFAPYVLDFGVLRKPDPDNPCGSRQVKDKINSNWHLYPCNLALLFGGRATVLTKYGGKPIHQFCHTDSALGSMEVEDPSHPLCQNNLLQSKALPASFMFALEDQREIYINHPDHKIIKAVKKDGDESQGIYFDNLCWHGGITETEDVVVGDNPSKRKWRLALHGHLDSTHYHREPEELGIPTLGEDGGLYVLPEHSAIRMDPDQMKTDLVHYATNLATLVDVLKQGDRRHVLSGIPPHVRRVLEEEFGGGECKD